ncbi:PD-(D/E)XK nuclease-like domain-containing protein [Myceligenerans halotolerans]
MTAETVTTARTGLVLGMKDVDYHGGPELSSTGAKAILRSPAKYAYEREHPVHKDVYDVGTVAHALVLGTPLDVAVIPGPWNTKAAKAGVEQARADGQVPLKPEAWEQIQDMAAKVLEHRAARALLERDGVAEASAFWTDDETGVACRARFDWLTENGGRALIGDYKTTQDASPRGFASSVAKFAYYQQDPWYIDAAEALGYDDPAFVFIAQEKEPPYLVGTYELRAADREMGRERNALAREIFRDCTEAGIWPAYSDDVQFLDLPKWVGYQHMEDFQ